MRLPAKGLIKKIFLGISVVLFVASFSFPPLVHSKYTPLAPNTNVFTKYKEVLESGDMNLPQWGLSNIDYLVLGLNKTFLGIPTIEGEQTNRGGVIGIFADLIGGMYQNKPVSSVQYFAYLGNKIQIAKPAYAQGQGWTFIQPILPLWVGVRNIAYAFFVVIFVAIGFMIMFRQKIDAQTAVSIQNALPKIIISLILVTFSYAICGLIVDLAYFLTSILYSIFAPIFTSYPDPALKGPELYTYSKEVNIFGVASIIMTKIITGGLPYSPLGEVGGFFIALGNVFKGNFAAIFTVVIGFTVLSTVIRIFLSLLSRYVILIIYPIFSPLIFLFGSLPGQKDHTPRFLKSYLSAVLTFPITILVLNFSSLFFEISTQGVTLKPPLVPLSPFDIPGTFTKSPQLLAGFVGIGILMFAAKIPEMIDDALSVKTDTSLGAEAGGALRRIPVIGSMMG